MTFAAATGGDTPLAYSVSGDPSWLSLSGRTLSGTPTATGTHTITITVTDNDGDTDSDSFVLTVAAAAVLLQLSDFSVPTGHDEVDVALITSGLDSNGWLYNVDISAGTLEDGSIEPESGNEITRVRHNGTNLLQLNDNPSAADISAFFASGGAGNDLTIYIQDATGVASFVVADQTVDSAGNNWVRWNVPDSFETVLARIAVDDLFILAFTRPTATVDLMPSAPTVADQTGVVGTAFSTTLPVGTGGDTPLAYSVSGEPTWASFSSTTRVLSGTPDAAATTTVTYTVEDDDGDTDSTTFDIVVSAADLMPTAPAIADQTANVGTAYTQTLPVGTGGDAPLAYSTSGLPAGLSFASTTRVLSGTPTTAQTYTVTYTVTDNDGDTDDSTFDIVVSAALTGTSLFDDSIFLNSTPGVAWLGLIWVNLRCGSFRRYGLSVGDLTLITSLNELSH